MEDFEKTNQLIADYMGLVPRIKTPPAMYDQEDGSVSSVKNLLYPKSWDALKPVLTKLQDMYLEDQKKYSFITDHFPANLDIFANIADIYSAVVSCIEEINNCE